MLSLCKQKEMNVVLQNSFRLALIIQIQPYTPWGGVARPGIHVNRADRLSQRQKRITIIMKNEERYDRGAFCI